MPSPFPIRLFLQLFSPVAVLILAGAWFAGSDRIESELGLVKAAEIGNVIMGVRRLDDELRTPLRQLDVLDDAPETRTALDSADLAALESEFATLIGYNRAIDKIRWIDRNGAEHLRVDNRAGQALATPPGELQNLAGRDDFRAALALKPGEIHLSPLGLDSERGTLATPRKPVLRLAAPVRDGAGQARGVLVLDIAAQGLLDAFRESVADARDHAMLVDRAGYWLVSPDPEQEWGFVLPHKQSLAKANPAAWKAIAAIPSGQQERADGLWTWSTVYPLKVGGGNVVDLPSWLVVAHLPDNQLAPIRDRALRQASALGGVLLLLFGLLSAWLARAQTGWARAEIETARANVEAASAKRLNEVLERFRLMVEANSNGLLVVDREGRIVLTNPALERMFGYTGTELLGQRLDMLLPETEHRLHGEHLSAYMNSPQARPMGAGRDLHGRRKDGGIFPIEVSLSPFTENGELYVDALVADISERKRIAGAVPA